MKQLILYFFCLYLMGLSLNGLAQKQFSPEYEQHYTGHTKFLKQSRFKPQLISNRFWQVPHENENKLSSFLFLGKLKKYERNSANALFGKQFLQSLRLRFKISKSIQLVISYF